MCGHSLEVNVTTSLDFYLSVAQVQLLQQLLKDNMLGSDASETRAEVHHRNRRKMTRVEIKCLGTHAFATYSAALRVGVQSSSAVFILVQSPAFCPSTAPSSSELDVSER